jgi:hypothetical protein
VATLEPPVKKARVKASTPREHPSDVAGAGPGEEAQPPETGNFFSSCLLLSAWFARESFPGLIQSDLDAAAGAGAVAGDPMKVADTSQTYL